MNNNLVKIEQLASKFIACANEIIETASVIGDYELMSDFQADVADLNHDLSIARANPSLIDDSDFEVLSQMVLECTEVHNELIIG